MHYQTKKCPYCRQVYENNTYLYRVNKYGSPLKTCKKCGKVFMDPEYKEIAIDGIKKADTRYISTPMLVCMCIFVVMIAVMMLAGITKAWVMGVAVIGIGLYNESKRRKFLQEETEASKERIKDPQYILALKQRGYNFPKNFLQNYFLDDMKQESCDILDNIRLTVVRTGEVVESRKTPLYVGRKFKDGVSLDSKLVSRMHAYFQYENGEWFLVDNCSTNGTYINDNKLEPNRKYPLCKGDIISFAGEKVIFFEAKKEDNDFETRRDANMVCVYAPPELMGRKNFSDSRNNTTYPIVHAFTENKCSETEDNDTYMEEVYGSPDMFRK